LRFGILRNGGNRRCGEGDRRKRGVRKVIRSEIEEDSKEERELRRMRREKEEKERERGEGGESVGRWGKIDDVKV
jgi:hypothetical protein